MYQDTDYLPVTVYVEDVNDNAPEFIGGPYNITVDELTPPGNFFVLLFCFFTRFAFVD